MLVLVALFWIGITAPTETHPLFYFGLIFVAGGAFSLLFAGVGAATAGSRAPAAPEADLRFFQGIRRLVLAMWLCAVVADALGVLVVLAIADGRGGTPLSATTEVVVFIGAAVTIVWAGITSVVMRRVLPRG
ncbi:hypothetical protein SAMN05216266_11942 [Amycolatopsis marina]|uniref:Uncharacterized protein n=1 Tax=Amycolatopsis marina TaxID=490629 RepID=A0A1I1BZ78_9PSEU|nr:hypothetical protein SAMN05216266_11942 [Amycolatopsis marina]